MLSYALRINEFAQGKSLLRLARPVRNRADAMCDACGSAEPRTLYALKDVTSEQYFFVGVTCLQEISKRGVVLRRFGKGNGREAYESEMQRRAQEQVPEGHPAMIPSINTSIAPVSDGPMDSEITRSLPIDGGLSFPPIVVVESGEFYEALVWARSPSDGTWVCGRVSEPRYEEVLSTRWEGGLLLERVKRERLDALAQCISRAWREANLHLTDHRLLESPRVEDPRPVVSDQLALPGSS